MKADWMDNLWAERLVAWKVDSMVDSKASQGEFELVVQWALSLVAKSVDRLVGGWVEWKDARWVERKVRVLAFLWDLSMVERKVSWWVDASAGR